MMKTRKILAALGFVALIVTSAQVAAIPVTYAGSANFGAGGVGYRNGSVAPNPNSSTTLVGVGIGGDSFTTTDKSYDFSKTGQFNTWCVDIYHWLSGSNHSYDIGTDSQLAASLNALRPGTPTGGTRVNDLLLLANDVYSTVNTLDESAAFQLAVWAITYGNYNSSGKYFISSTPTPSTGFWVDSTTANQNYTTLANSWLSNLGAATPDTGNYKLTYLNDGTANNTQDMVVFTSVPEPASLGLLAIGLLGVGMMRRKMGR